MARIDPRGIFNPAMGGVMNRQHARLHGPSPGDAIFNRSHFDERAADAMAGVARANFALSNPAGPLFQVRPPGSMGGEMPGLVDAYMAQTQAAQPQSVENSFAGRPSLFNPANVIRDLIGHLF